MQLDIRTAEPSDLNAILRLFRECVMNVCREDYSSEQLAAWASATNESERWMGKIKNDFFLVALSGQEIVGFASLESKDEIDFLYVHRAYQRCGIASELYGQLVTRAEHLGATELKAEVSKTARPFFEGKGFEVVTEQWKTVGGTRISNYLMRIELRNESN